MSKDIRVRYAPSPTGLLHIGMPVQHCSTTFMHVITVELLLSVSKILTVNAMSKMVNVHNLKTFVGWVWIGTKVQKHMKTTASLNVWTCIKKYIDQLLVEGKAYKSYVTEEELATERERQEAAGETPRYINEYLGMSEEEKAAYIAEREAAGIIPTVRLAVNESGIYKWHDMVKGDIEFEGGNIGGDWVIQKKDGYPNLQLCRCHR